MTKIDFKKDFSAYNKIKVSLEAIIDTDDLYSGFSYASWTLSPVFADEMPSKYIEDYQFVKDIANNASQNIKIPNTDLIKAFQKLTKIFIAINHIKYED